MGIGKNTDGNGNGMMDGRLDQLALHFGFRLQKKSLGRQR